MYAKLDKESNSFRVKKIVFLQFFLNNFSNCARRKTAIVEKAMWKRQNPSQR